MVLAAVQMNSGADVAANLAALDVELQRAQQLGARLVVLPENFALMSESRQDRLALAEEEGSGPVQARVARLAADLGLWIVAGSVPVRSADSARPYSACFVYDSDGTQIACYKKIHLFDVQVPDADDAQSEVYSESSFTMPGADAVVVQTPWGRLGIAICYDLRFPGFIRQMLAGGLDILAVPAAFTVATGRAHWELLLRARAVENLCYVVAGAQTGSHPGGRETWGHAMIVDPWGAVLSNAGSLPGTVIAAYDQAQMNRLRSEFPVLDHRRL